MSSQDHTAVHRLSNLSAQMAPTSRFTEIPMAPPDAILGLTEEFKADQDKRKVSLGVGAYRDEQGKPYVLQCVLEAEKRILAKHFDKEYAPIPGFPEYGKLVSNLAFGDNSPAVQSDRIAIVQALSGTGALRVGGDFLKRFWNTKTIYIPTPTWPNHNGVFNACDLEIKQYRYYDAKAIGLDIEGMLADLRAAKEGSVILLHACAHNPTGVDPTREDWERILEVVKEKQLLPFFDAAYLGFASGDYDHDAYAIRHFVDAGITLLLAVSFAKNMGLYGERAGAFAVHCASKEEKTRVFSQLKIISRVMISSPPIHAAHLVIEILSDNHLKQEWFQETKHMADRIKSMRSQLKDGLKKVGSKRDWSHITSQIGMFCFSGLTPDEVQKLKEKHHVYLTKDGRISMAGVTTDNVEYIANAIVDVTQ